MSGEPSSIFSAEILHKELNIPRRYLRILLTNLSKHGFIESNRGRAGGFRLCCDTQNKSVAEVIDAIEGLNSYDRCFFGIENCRNAKPCAMHQTWSETRDALMNTLTQTTIGELGKDSVMKF